MKRRISIVRNPGKGDVLANKGLTIKLDGLNQGTLEAGYRLVFDASDKAHTLNLSYTGEWNLELNHPIPAGDGDAILVLNCEENNYTISEGEYRRLTIRRDNGAPTLGLWVEIDGRNHPQAWILDNVGDWMTVCVDTAAHSVKLQAHGLFGSKNPREVTVPAGSGDEEYIAIVNDDKTVTVNRKKWTIPKKEQQTAQTQNQTPTANNNILPGGLSDGKMLNSLNNQLNESNGKLFEKLFMQNKSGPTSLRVDVGSRAISFNLKTEDGFRTAATLHYEHLADTSIPGVAERGIALNTQEERNAVLRFVHDFVYSSKNVHFALYMDGNNIYLEEEYAQKLRMNLLEKTEDIYGSSTTYHLKMELKALLNPENGEVYQWLRDADTVRVAFGAVDDCMVISADIMVDGKVKSPAQIQELYYQNVNRNTDELRRIAKMTGGNFPDSVNPFDFLETWEKEQLLNEILQQFINSDQCPGVYYEDHEIKLEPGCGIDVADSITMSFLKGDYLKPLMYLPHGILCDAMCSQNPPAEYIDVEVGTMGISFQGHFRGMAAGEIKTVFTVLWDDINNETVLLAAEKMKGVKGHGPAITRLEDKLDRDEVIRVIREYINAEVPVAEMKGRRITLNPEVFERPKHPDMNYSLTASVLWVEMLNRFGEESDFAKRAKETPATCIVAAEADRLKVTVMLEDEVGTTETVEMKYSECTFDKLSWDQLKVRDWQNRFERLDDPADQKELVDYLMWMMDVFRHIVIEGQSFRTRRKGEDIIEVDQTLTGQMMARKVKTLFNLDGEFIDILRHSNIDFCHIAGYRDYLAFIFNDRDGNVVKTIYRDFSELVDEDFLSGDDCFDHLTCGYEKDELSYFLGKSVGSLPYMRTRSVAHLDSNILFLNRDMVPMLDEPYLADPSKSAEPVADETPQVHENPEVPAVQEKPVWTVENSPTTNALVTAMNQQFAEGGAMRSFMKDAGYSGAEMMTGSSEVVIGFWKNGTCCSRISMQYAQFSKGKEGDYQVLAEEDQKALQEIIRRNVPYFDI